MSRFAELDRHDLRYHGDLGGKARIPATALWAVLAVSSCFSFEPAEGLSCSESGACPSDQVCAAGVCLRASGLSGADAAAAIDASDIDAKPEGCAPATLLCRGECLPACDTSFKLPGETSYQPEEGCATLRITAWGAGAGHGAGNTRGGAGGYATLDLPLASQETFAIVVGAPGGTPTAGAGGSGGLPGGGKGGNGGSQSGGGGGGFSGVFRGAIEPANAVLIAGGGGGSGGGGGNANNTIAGAGGGLQGQSGRLEGTPTAGGTQTSGFAPLLGQSGGNDSDGGGGGGGGWFGGRGGSGANSDAQGAGGGSGYVGDALVSEIVAGNRGVPGNAISPLRGVAGNPTEPGIVHLSCLAPGVE